jgi:predicted component of viral defense system (DUF524 family)
MEVKKLDIIIPKNIFGKDVTLTIYPESNSKLHLIEDIIATENGESQYQLLEGCCYEYTFSETFLRLNTTIFGIVYESKREASCGRITPNIYVGTLALYISDVNKKDYSYKVNVEVLATKFNSQPDKSYRENYRFMIKEITDKCTELLMQINSPVEQNFEIDFNKDNETIYQRFSFINAIIQDKNFEEALQKVISSPKTNWCDIEEVADIRSVKRFTNSTTKQLISGSNRIKFDSNHPLFKSDIESLPNKIISRRKVEHFDTPENRFIKHALEVFLLFSEDCLHYFKKFNYSRPRLEALNLVTKLETSLSHSFFKEISRPTSLKLNSPVLQRKSGYRELLNAWLQFDLAAKLIWKGGDDVYQAGKRDIATLYEYWLFFKLYDLFNNKFGLNKLEQEENDYEHLIVPTKDGLNLMVKQGKHTALSGVFNSGNRNLKIKFSYNRTFKGGTNYKEKKAGSFTTTLRPDYTLSVWPAEFEEHKAEENELIVHIHFDAKYKVVQFEYNTTDSGLEEEEENEQKGTYKNVDLLKMHTYKDAIRRTGGAYVLYPGSEKKEIRGFHEIIPGLGAFAINPSENNTGINDLSRFIDLVIENLKDRASQRENISNKSFIVHQFEKNDHDTMHDIMPEYLNGIKLIPDETYVIVGYANTSEKLKWYLEKGLYNFRMDDDKGSLELSSEVTSAKYLLLREKGSDTVSKLYRIKSKGPKVCSLKKLKELGYPASEKSKDYYLVITIDKEPCNDFNNALFKFRELEVYKKIKAGLYQKPGIPFAVSIRDLMKVKIISSVK